ncbi:MAG: hypothetical protein JST09_13715 [Bacteroidetes bacterium]|nr:hypothetical protein [Bacteroidota bacterium]
MTQYRLLLVALLIKFSFAKAQDYHAIQGSCYAGSLGVHNNPASIVMCPFKWDITLVGGQLKSASNLFTIYNYSLLSNPVNSLYNFTGGYYERFSALALNLNLLNGRIALGRKSAIAFGLNLKSYSEGSSTPYNFYDTLKSSGDFFKINNPANLYSAKITSSSWAEIYATYARTIFDNEAIRLNAGLTVKVSKGLSGASGRLENAGYNPIGNNRYSVNSAYLEYVYSSNFDYWQKNESNTANLRNFLKYTNGSASVDAGFEYIIKPQELTSYPDNDNYYDYSWKIGVSLLDIGFNKYHSGNKSAVASSIKTGITNVELDNKFDSTITSLQIFNDSLSTLVNNFSVLNTGYKIINPMRLVVNVDHFVLNNFYINAELSVNVPPSWTKNWRSVRQMNLLTLTPRWEKRTFGIYLPIQYTNNNRFWIGGAFKAGPLLVGIHNWANIFTKNSMQNGGGYIALIIRSPQNIAKKLDKRLECPPL